MGCRMVIYGEDEENYGEPVYDEDIDDDMWVANLADSLQNAIKGTLGVDVFNSTSFFRTRDISGGVKYPPKPAPPPKSFLEEMEVSPDETLDIEATELFPENVPETQRMRQRLDPR